jgi:dUTP pyrophosphatase
MDDLELAVKAAKEKIEESKAAMLLYLSGEMAGGISKSQLVKIYSRGGNELIPQYKTQGSSGLDLAAYMKEPMVVQPNQIFLVPTGIYVDLPDDTEFQLRPRSGTAYKKGLTLINCVGTIDDDYVDEIKVAMINLSGKEQTIEPNERIAQMVFAKVEKLTWDVVDSPEDFNSKDRTGGFGSTGTK